MSRPIEAKCVSHGKNAQGGRRFSFVSSKDDNEIADLIEVGWRYALAIVPIGDDELPIKSGEAQDASGKTERTDSGVATPSHEPRPRNHFAQKAGIMADELKFQLWISQRWPKQAQECGTAAEFIRKWCGVKSRAEILPETEAAGKFHRLVELYELAP